MAEFSGMNRLLRTITAFGLLSFASAALAQDYIVLDQRADEFDRWQDRVDASYGTPPVTIISRETNVPVPVLEEQRARTRLGYGGLLIGNALAIETGRSFDEIAALKSSGQGWGQIAKQYGVKIGPVVSRLHRADNDFRSTRKLKHAEKKAQKFANGHDNRGGQGKGKKEKQGGNGIVKAKGHGGGHGGGHGKH
jgi:hypothetical protein